jgi:hypothetical protein
VISRHVSLAADTTTVVSVESDHRQVEITVLSGTEPVFVTADPFGYAAVGGDDNLAVLPGTTRTVTVGRPWGADPGPSGTNIQMVCSAAADVEVLF